MRNLAPLSGQDLSAPSPRGSDFGRDDRAKNSVSPITYYFLLITSLILLIISLIITAIWWFFLRERIGYIVANPLMASHRRIPLRIVGLWIIRSMIVLALVSIIIGVGKSETREVIEKQKQNILIVLDISRSMLAEDISPSRIEAAKQTIATFLTERRDDVFGLIVFAGKPFVSIPFSTDTQGISSVLANLNTYYIRQDLPWLSGTAIGDALLLANSTLSGQTDKSSIVLITDGRANVGIDPMIASQESKEKGIPIFTIAIGSTTNEILSYMDPYTSKRVTLLDESGAPLRSDIDEALLQSISETTGGAYYRVTGARELYDYWDRISARLGNNTETSIQTAFVSYRLYLLLVLFVLVLIERIATTQIFYKKGR